MYHALLYCLSRLLNNRTTKYKKANSVQMNNCVCSKQTKINMLLIHRKQILMNNRLKLHLCMHHQHTVLQYMYIVHKYIQYKYISTLKANWVQFKSHMKDFRTNFTSNFEGKSVNQLWTELKDAIHTGLSLYISCKIVSGKKSLPWITHQIKRYIRKKGKSIPQT